MKIVAHTVFKNEVNWLWYSVTSVIEHVDKLLLWDTGSTDGSWEIAKKIRKLYPERIELKQYGSVTPGEFPVVRQKMLDATSADWLLVVDGDEVWWEDSIVKLVKTIRERGNGLEMIVNTNINPVGDIFHIIPSQKGRYNIDGRSGFFNIRAINLKVEGLHAKGDHGVQGYYDGENKLIQDGKKNRKLYCDYGYMHMTNLKRSKSPQMERKVPKRAKKFKYELGSPLPLDFYYPESFFKPKPRLVPTPWNTRSNKYISIALLQKPLKFLKNKLGLHKKYGY
ncbi:glycosyltransferase [Candidatus Microgenomates bacterium]|nr:glycosyltransferase [Candidatus Microgenomates bacterium]